MSMNKVIIEGFLGKDPEFKCMPTGNTVATMSVGVSEQWKDKLGQHQQKIQWFRVIRWGKAAESCKKYLFKGSQVLVEGKLSTRVWEHDGIKTYITEVIASNIQFIGKRKENKEEEKEQVTYEDDTKIYAADVEGLNF